MAPSPTITKDRIKKSFIQLLNFIPLESISIKQLCDTAEISRTSFYHYYNNLNEVLKELFDNSFEKSFVSKKWDLIQFVANKKTKLLNHEILHSMTYKSLNYSNYILTYLIGRYFIICSQWIKNGKSETKEELIMLLLRLNEFKI